MFLLRLRRELQTSHADARCLLGLTLLYRFLTPAISTAATAAIVPLRLLPQGYLGEGA